MIGGLTLTNPGFVGSLGGGGGATYGIIDTVFSTNAGVGADGTIYDMALCWNGKILIVGEFTYFNGHFSPKIARLNADGSYDTTFDVGSGFNVAPDCIIFDGTFGGCYVGGSFSNYKGASCPQVIRINEIGNRMTSFNPTFSFGGYSVTALYYDINSAIVIVGGGFSSRVVALLDYSGDVYITASFGGTSVSSITGITRTVFNGFPYYVVSGTFDASGTSKGVIGLSTSMLTYQSSFLGTNPSVAYSIAGSRDANLVDWILVGGNTGLKKLSADGWPTSWTPTGVYYTPEAVTVEGHFYELSVATGAYFACGSQSVTKINADGTAPSNYENQQYQFRWDGYGATFNAIVVQDGEGGVIVAGTVNQALNLTTGQIQTLPNSIFRLTNKVG